MRIGDLPAAALAQRMAAEGIVLDIGSASLRVRSDSAGLAQALGTVYAEFPLVDDEVFCQISASIRRVGGTRRLVHPQVEYEVDGSLPFEPFPAHTHLPLLEWGVNWTLAERSNHCLLLHSGVVEKQGVGIVLPAVPGSGKSTLTAALMLSGYRLLSDEFGVVRFEDGALMPMLKGAALKNASIDVIRGAFPHARLGPSFPKTRKGTVAHLAPDAHSVRQRGTPAAPGLIVFPLYQAEAETALEVMGSSQAFSKLVVNSFNYELLGAAGFEAACKVIDACECYRLTYSELASGIQTIDRLVDSVAGRRR
jgi:HprK-related kinase A